MLIFHSYSLAQFLVSPHLKQFMLFDEFEGIFMLELQIDRQSSVIGALVLK